MFIKRFGSIPLKLIFLKLRVTSSGLTLYAGSLMIMEYLLIMRKFVLLLLLKIFYLTNMQRYPLIFWVHFWLLCVIPLLVLFIWIGMLLVVLIVVNFFHLILYLLWREREFWSVLPRGIHKINGVVFRIADRVWFRDRLK